jgi:hypothetical protein
MRYIAMLNSIRAQEIMDPSGKGYGLENPAWELRVIEDGKTRSLFAGPKDPKEFIYFVKRDDALAVYRLSGYYFQDLNVTNDSFVQVPEETKKEAAVLAEKAKKP